MATTGKKKKEGAGGIYKKKKQITGKKSISKSKILFLFKSTVTCPMRGLGKRRRTKGQGQLS